MVYVKHVIGTRDRRAVFLDFLRVVGPGVPCIPWPWMLRPGGYARVSVDGEITSAHRWVWANLNGPIPDGVEVCHNCPEGDSPSCVRPDHLWLGSHSENIRDAYSKGRAHANREHHPKGEDHWGAKLTAEAVLDIRRRAGGRNQSALAREYGVRPATVSNIVHRRIWKHLPEEV